MPKGFSGWTYRDVIKFLKDYSFYFYEQREGSHEAWISENNESIVEVNYHAKRNFPQRTVEMFARQSGLGDEVWRQWAKNGKKRIDK